MKARQIPLFKVHMPDTVCEALEPVLASGYIAGGEQVHLFEDLLRAFVGNPNVTTMSDISGAITLALFMAGVRPEDEVIVSPMCCTATTMPIANLFAHPVWCDVDPLTGMMDASRIPELITPKTKAVLFYHWAGDVADIDAINDITHAHGLKTIDDAAEGFGAKYKGKRLGNNGTDFTAYSFHAVKHLTTGEGGALFCSSLKDAERARWLKHYGIYQPTFRLPTGDLNPESDVPEPGYNFYMTNIAATIGIEQFNHIQNLLRRHRQNGQFYDSSLAGIAGIELLRRQPDTSSAYWTYTILAEQRNNLQRKLKEEGIVSQRLHIRNDRYSCFPNANRDLPGVDSFDRRTLSIPCGWWVTDADRECIVDAIRKGW